MWGLLSGLIFHFIVVMQRRGFRTRVVQPGAMIGGARDKQATDDSSFFSLGSIKVNG